MKNDIDEPREENSENNAFSEERQQLQEDWQSYQPDIAKIKRRIQWVTWRMVAVLFLDIVVLVTYVPFLLYFVLPEETSLALKIWHVGMFPLLLYGVYWDFKLRLPLFKLENESTSQILKFYMRRVNAGVKLGHFGYRFCLLLVVFFLLWVGAGFVFDLGEKKLTELPFILFGTVWIGLFAAVMYWYKRKKLKEKNYLEELWSEFLE